MKGYSGFTLIEILIAIIVFGIAIVGILALVLTAIPTSNESTEDTIAATLASSVYHALALAMKSPSYDSDTQKYKVLFLHDLQHQGNGIHYYFLLPKIQDGRMHHPSGAEEGTPVSYFAEYPNNNSIPIFRTGGDSQVYSYARSVMAYKDPTDPYLQLGFFFSVAKKPYTVNSSQQEKYLVYEFHLYIVRCFAPTGASGGGGGGGTGTGGYLPPHMKPPLYRLAYKSPYMANIPLFQGVLFQTTTTVPVQWVLIGQYSFELAVK
jgi:prepilin-type N-terminal cleavage/methylation domain-containing protein